MWYNKIICTTWNAPWIYITKRRIRRSHVKSKTNSQWNDGTLHINTRKQSLSVSQNQLTWVGMFSWNILRLASIAWHVNGINLISRNTLHPQQKKAVCKCTCLFESVRNVMTPSKKACVAAPAINPHHSPSPFKCTTNPSHNATGIPTR